jgi:hypothetical protein
VRWEKEENEGIYYSEWKKMKGNKTRSVMMLGASAPKYYDKSARNTYDTYECK